MYSYQYGDQYDSESLTLKHFFTSHTDPELRRIIHFARFLTIEVLAVLILVIAHAVFRMSATNVEAAIVQPVDDTVVAQLIPTHQPAPTNQPIPEIAVLGAQDIALPEFAQPLKSKYTIALYGDSMVDTMGEVGEYLEHALKKMYPQTNFLIYNYGVGSQNARDGLDRFYKRLDYQSRHYPSIAEIKPDIIIMGSFAYNVFTPHNRDRHWITLTQLVQEAQKTEADVYMLAEIAPLRNKFGVGPHGVNWDTDTVYKHSGNIIEQLENVIGLSATLHVPLIDAFTPSKKEFDNEGKSEYVNTDDGIHPSVAGHEFMADLIAHKLELK